MGFYTDDTETVRLTLSLFSDGSFVESKDSIDPQHPVRIENGSWVTQDNTVVLSRDGLKDERWKIIDNTLVQEGEQPSIHRSLHRID